MEQDRASGRTSSVVSWVVTLFLVGLIVAVVLYGLSRREPEVAASPRRLPNVEVSRLESRVYREALVLPARVQARRVAAVSPEFGGKLAAWHVPEGGRVAEGDVVASLDTSLLKTELGELQARLSAAERGVERSEAGVEAGEVALESAREQAKVRDLALDAARSDRELAETEFQRVENLVEQGVMDRARLDTARNARTQAKIRVRQAEQAVVGARLGIRNAEARLAEARAARELAKAGVVELSSTIESVRIRLGKSDLRAPIGGRLEEYLVEPGEVVAAGAALAHVYDLESLRAVVEVPDRYVAFLDPDNPAVAEYIRMERSQAKQELDASLIVPGLPKLTGGEQRGIELPAELVRVDQAADPASNTFEVELEAANPGDALKHGLIVRARIEYLTYPEAIVIPVRAVQVTDAGPRVMVVVEEGGQDVVRVRDIEPASVSEDELLVLAGLTPGEQLVVSGWKGLVSGEPVRVIPDNGSPTVGATPGIETRSPIPDP